MRLTSRTLRAAEMEPSVIESMYGLALSNMEVAFGAMQRLVPTPKEVIVNGHPAYRYVEKTIQQAIVLKLVRYISGLRASKLLLDYGYVQELGAVQRTLQDIEEDITFLALAEIRGNTTDLHSKFLDAFWQEEFDESAPKVRSLERPMVSRKKVRAYNVNSLGVIADPSGAISASRTVTSVYSGFVHAAAPHIMDLYGGHFPHFHLAGIAGTPRQEEHREDLWNQFYRGLLVCAEAAKAMATSPRF